MVAILIGPRDYHYTVLYTFSKTLNCASIDTIKSLNLIIDYILTGSTICDVTKIHVHCYLLVLHVGPAVALYSNDHLGLHILMESCPCITKLIITYNNFHLLFISHI